MRELAHIRTDGFCQFCGRPAAHVHHVQYPKQLGSEHPDTLIPVCERCHNLAHGVQEVKQLETVSRMNELTPTGNRLNYLLSDARVYASTRSWIRALGVPDSWVPWFEQALPKYAILKKDRSGGLLVATHEGVPVYRWPVVARSLRAFDHAFMKSQYESRSPHEREELKKFHENYEELLEWGYDLQERAISSAFSPVIGSSLPASQDDLVEVVKHAVTPRLQEHDNRLSAQEIYITEIRGAVPSLRDPNDFITVKQAISEMGLDPTQTPLHPHSKENLSGLAGQMLKDRKSEQGASTMSRIDGQSITAEMNTYRRGKIYATLDEILRSKQEGFSFPS